MREPFPTNEEAFNTSYPVLQFSKLSLYCLGIPVEVLRSLTDEDMQSICNTLTNWFAEPHTFTKVLQMMISVFLTGKGWEWEYDTETYEVRISKRPLGQSAGENHEEPLR